MRKLIYLVVVLFTTISCNEEQSANYANISGKIENINPKGNKVTIIDITDPLFSKTIQVSNDGSFNDTLTVKKNGLYIFYYNKGGSYFQNGRMLYMDKGYNLNINFDTEDFYKTLTFSGIGSRENTYLLKKKLFLDEMSKKGVYKYLNDKSISEKDFLKASESFKNEIYKLLDNTDGLSKKFIAKEKKEIEYTSLYDKAKFFKDTIPKKYLNGVSNPFTDLDYNEGDFRYSTRYRDLIDLIKNYKLQKLYASDSSRNQSFDELIMLDSIDDKIIKNYLLFESVQYRLANIPDSDKEDYYNAYMSYATDEKLKKEITSIYKEVISITKGQPSRFSRDGGQTNQERRWRPPGPAPAQKVADIAPNAAAMQNHGCAWQPFFEHAFSSFAAKIPP